MKIQTYQPVGKKRKKRYFYEYLELKTLIDKKREPVLYAYFEGFSGNVCGEIRRLAQLGLETERKSQTAEPAL